MIYTIDLETDPFLEGRFPMPFSSGFYDGQKFTYFWGDDAIPRMRSHIETLPPGIIYAHNGGRFDIYYLMGWIAGRSMRVINSRIISASMACDTGDHSLRDSYAIMPFALGSYKGKKRKLEMAYWKLENFPCCDLETKQETTVRLLHKAEILEYLEMDCVLLWELCSAFHEKFGDKLTIGSTAMKELSKIHSFEKLNPSWDAFIRGGRMPSPNQKEIRHGYYYGGRVECFGKGIISGDFKIYDVNSMYPFVMKSMRHPIGSISHVGREITEHTCFVKVEGRNYGAFPMRAKDGLRFDVKYGIFHVTIHEYLMALKYGLFKPRKIILTVDFFEQGTFSEFVDKFYTARQDAKAIDDAINEMFFKLILNSAYGKFSQNPERYEDNVICQAGWENCPGDECFCHTEKCKCGCSGARRECKIESNDCDCNGWRVKEMSTLFAEESKNYWVWKCNSKDFSRFNVATGASITGASRALLMEAIHLSKRPVYTDTDCVICEDLPIVSIDAKKLGSWKVEGEGTMMAIGGKKMYVLFDENQERISKREIEASVSGKRLEYVGNLQCVKKANKGVSCSARDIFEVANGGVVRAKRDAPTFSLSGDYRFISRDVRMTI
jgi:DNA polymerase type B, organellar and viral